MRTNLFAISMAVSALLAPEALAQTSYPERTVRVIVPFAPGGATDAVARPWGEKMRQLMGSVVMENMGGAGGATGAAAAARAKPDGYTLLIGSISTQVITPVISHPAPFDPVKDFDHIAMLVVSNLAFGVHPDIPVKTLKELVDYTKNNPGKISYGTPGSGSLNHLLGELFKTLTGAGDMAHVPYRGGGPALTDLIAGQLPMIVPVMTGQITELHKAGKLRLLAVTGEARLPNLPDVPTGVEAGVPNLIAQGFYGLFAPAGTPKDILQKIGDTSRKVMNDPEIGKLMYAAGFEPVLDASPEKTRRTLEADIARWTPIVGKVGLKRE